MRNPFRRKARIAVVFDEVGVRRVRGTKEVEAISWDDLARVDIATTSEGPFVDDVFWLLGDGSGHGVVVPSEGVPEGLLERLQALPGFDSKAVIDAMACAEDALFPCWSRGST